ncbi:ABC transporter ATP-binding protein [Rhizobium leguminosarum]|nr:ABC transporter ATP-binding protein [Rhizobium leguminosarum]
MSPVTNTMSDDTLLKVEHLSMKFGGLMAINDFSFEAKRGDITALIGPNGAGKTTVFNCITGFYKPTMGMITFNQKSGKQYLLERLPDFRITREAKVARTFQNIRLFSGLTVLENLLVAQHNKLMKASGYTILGLIGVGPYKREAAGAIELARFWLEKADLIDRADDPAGDLPYGAQRRLEIARAMCTGPELLCLDEPAAGLNPGIGNAQRAAEEHSRRNRNVDPADRARHVGGHGNLRPRRRPRIWSEDFRWHAGSREERSEGYRGLSRCRG